MRLSSIFADTSKAKPFPAGTTIFAKGDKGEEMYVVKEGEVDIVINDFNFETVLPALIDKANNARFAMDTAASVSKSVQILFERALRFDSKILAGDNVFPAGRMDSKTKKNCGFYFKAKRNIISERNEHKTLGSALCTLEVWLRLDDSNCKAGQVVGSWFAK